MKKLFILFVLVLGGCFQSIIAQTVMDAVRYTNQNTIGTARYNAVGGAFGALGGDLSSLNNNPAGSAVFTQSAASVTGTLDQFDNKTNYYGGIYSVDDSDFSFNQVGGVFVLNNRNTDSKFKRLSFAVNYDRIQNFDNSYTATGISNSSIDEYFLGNAQGFELGALGLQGDEDLSDAYFNIGQSLGYAAQQGFLGYQAYVINPEEDADANTSYVSNIGSGDFDQEYNYTATGYNGKINFNVASQIGENFYFGLNLNSHFIDYEKETLFFEDNDNANSGVNSLAFRNNLQVLGNGFSFQVGGIYKISSLRIGASYDSPTWLTIDEETTQRLNTNGTEGQVTIAPNVVNVFESYDLKTPAKASGSVAFVGNKGFISFDYSFQDFSNIEFDNNAVANFTAQNTAISNELQEVSTYRVGAEYKLGPVSLRGGYRYETSPYKDEIVQSELTGFSAGLGYSFGAARLDFAYSRATQDFNTRLFEGNFENTTMIEQVNSNFIATLSFRL